MMQVMSRTTSPPAKSHVRDALISQVQAELALLTRTTDHFARRSDLYTDMERSWYIIALTLDAAGELSISELATQLALDGTTITRQVAAMDHTGLVQRTARPDDGRTRIVSLTSRGRERMLDVQNERVRRYDETLADWSDTELQDLATLTAKLNHAISAGAEHHTFPTATAALHKPKQGGKATRLEGAS
jgi:DNA-binding MarR family transcriptional regulator